MTATSSCSRYSGGQILGARARQEDVFRIVELSPDGARAALVLSDGMGGHSGGQEAAACVVESFVQAIKVEGGSLAARLRPALERANTTLAALKTGRKGCADAGCTLLVAAVEDGRLSWISVGDSPLYLVRGGALHRLNDDHSMRPVFAELAASGRMSWTADSEDNYNRNALRSAVVGEELSLVDEREDALQFQTGDVLLAASDGIEVLPPGTLIQLLSGAEDARTISGRLLQAVTEAANPRQDNTTVLIYLPAPTRTIRPETASGGFNARRV